MFDRFYLQSTNFVFIFLGVQFKNIYLYCLASINPATLLNSKLEIKLVVLNLWGMFNIDFHFLIELTGGMGFKLTLSIGEDCHGRRKFGKLGYCDPDCQCGAAEGACKTHNDCYDGLYCRDEGKEYSMPGLKVCVVEDQWPNIVKDNTFFELSLWTPTWYNIFEFQIKSFTANFGKVVEYIFDSIWAKARAILNHMSMWGGMMNEAEVRPNQHEEQWDSFKTSESWQTLRGGLDHCRRRLDSTGLPYGTNECQQRIVDAYEYHKRRSLVEKEEITVFKQIGSADNILEVNDDEEDEDEIYYEHEDAYKKYEEEAKNYNEMPKVSHSRRDFIKEGLDEFDRFKAHKDLNKEFVDW